MRFILLSMLTILATPLHADELGGYFRAWQGFEGEGNLMENLPKFMQMTVDTYDGKGLNNYMVAIPPADHHEVIPDEFALVMLTSKADYDAVRSTPEGRAYGEAHFPLFDEFTSRSAPQGSSIPESLVHNNAYDVIGTPVDWSKGHTLFFLGTRKKNVRPTDFLKRLSSHIQLVSKTLKPHGLQGYVIIANENYEAAYIHWESQAAADAAYASADAEVIWKDAGEILDKVMFEAATPFDGVARPGIFYSTSNLLKP